MVGLGVAGEAAARRLAEHGWDVVVLEDRPGPLSRSRAASLAGRGITTVEAPDSVAIEAMVARTDLVVPSPPVPPSHPAVSVAVAAGIPVWSEFELAAHWSTLAMVAVTGTNGKTTVTTLVEAMLTASGLQTVSAGNNDLPLVDALDDGLDVVVVEASSFRLCFTERFRPRVATWLNHAEDHLDWHPSMEHYRAAKARVWAAQEPGDVAVANAEDPVVMAATHGLRSRVVTFGIERGNWRVEDGYLMMPEGVALLGVDELWRSLAHDRVNALAAAATALAAGASLDAVREALREFRGLPHRVSLVAEHEGVRFYDDSKATDPHAAVTAIAGFPSVVLIAGGRNKGLDLGLLAREAARLRGVVAVGEAAEDVMRAFGGTTVPVVHADSMDAAVAAARGSARPGDVVLLSPGCASFDWYSSYAERGDDFARAVTESIGAPA